MKILYVAGVGKYGTYILTRDIFRIWLKHGHEIVFVGPVPDKLMLGFADKHGIPVHSLPLARTFRIDQAIKLAAIAKKEKVDLIHACNLPPGRILCKIAGLLAGIPLVIYIGTPNEVYNVNPFLRRLQRFLHRWVILTSEGVIAMTRYLADQIRLDLKIPLTRQISVIPSGVDFSLIKRKEKSERVQDPICVVQAARLAPEKGQDLVLRAIKEVLNKGYKISVDFIGDESYPGYQERLYKLVEELNLPTDAFRFLGYHPAEQIYQELAEYDLFLHPSRSEGQGIAVVEAMAAGLPVVASEVGGLVDLLVKQETGLLVANEDHHALAEAVISLINDPARRISMGEAGYRRAKEEFSLAVTELKLTRFYARFEPKERLIYFQQNLAMGACEEYFYLLMQGVDKDKFEVIFVCPEYATLDPLVSKVKALGIKVQRYSPDVPNYRRILYLMRLFRRLKPALIHFNDPCLNGIIAAWLAGVKKIVMTHHTPELDRIYGLKGKILEKMIFGYIRPYAIFTSEYDMETGIKKDEIAREKSSVIYYGFLPEKFRQKYDKKDIYGEFALDEGCRIIANVARLNHQKGQSYLIEAAPLVIEKFKSVKFFFIGAGELESELKKQVKEKGLEDHFIFTGHRTDIPRLLSAVEILVMPSLFEGLCFAVIEASAMQVPVVATKVGGMRRSVADGKTGILVPPRDPKALADAILWMLEHPNEAKEMGLSGEIYFQEMFTVERMVTNTQHIYESLLAEQDSFERLKIC